MNLQHLGSAAIPNVGSSPFCPMFVSNEKPLIAFVVLCSCYIFPFTVW